MQKIASSRSFGLLLTAVLLAAVALSASSHGHAYPYWAASATVLLVISLALPRVLAPLKRLWLKFASLLHSIVSPLILGAVYLLVFIPIGALIRLFGKDLLSLKRDRSAASYWIERAAGGPAPESLKDQF